MALYVLPGGLMDIPRNANAADDLADANMAGK